MARTTAQTTGDFLAGRIRFWRAPFVNCHDAAASTEQGSHCLMFLPPAAPLLHTCAALPCHSTPAGLQKQAVVQEEEVQQAEREGGKQEVEVGEQVHGRAASEAGQAVQAAPASSCAGASPPSPACRCTALYRPQNGAAGRRSRGTSTASTRRTTSPYRGVPCRPLPSCLRPLRPSHPLPPRTAHSWWADRTVLLLFALRLLYLPHLPLRLPILTASGRSPRRTSPLQPHAPMGPRASTGS